MNITLTSSSNEKKIYQDSTYELVSKIAYLLGVPKRIFENEHEPPQISVYDEMQQEKSAQIIRNLSIVRSGILRNYRAINKKMHAEYKSIISMPEFVPTDCIQKLEAEGIHFIKKSSTKLYHHVIELNRVICDRINNCKPLFPIWLNWKYVQDLFVMPDGLTETGALNAVASFMRYLQDYPYQMYMNWIPCDAGNILYNDKKFATLLYQWHGDTFTEYNRVSDVSGYVKGSIHEYLSASEHTVIVVDCENSDPYKLCATLKGLDHKNIAKIAKIILFDDVLYGYPGRTYPDRAGQAKQIAGGHHADGASLSGTLPKPCRLLCHRVQRLGLLGAYLFSAGSTVPGHGGAGKVQFGHEARPVRIGHLLLLH